MIGSLTWRASLRHCSVFAIRANSSSQRSSDVCTIRCYYTQPVKSALEDSARSATGTRGS